MESTLTIPKLTDFSEHVVAYDKLAALQTALGEIEAERGRRRREEPGELASDDAVTKLLRSDDVATAVAEINVASAVSHVDLAAENKRFRALSLAIERQRNEVQRIVGECAQQAAKRLADEYRARVGVVKTKVRELAIASDDVREFVENFRDEFEGNLAGIRVMKAPGNYSLRARGVSDRSSAQLFLAECEEYGF